MKYSEEIFGRLALPYLAFEPEELGSGIQNEKLLIYLHGSGDRGKAAQEVREGWGLLRLLPNQIQVPFTVVAPICPQNETWLPDSIFRFIEGLKIFHFKKIILCGYSMGATGAYDFQAKYPNIVCGIVAVAGRVATFSNENMAKIPFYAVYGNEDERFIQSRIIERIKQVQKMGGVAKLKVLIGKGHFISDEVFRSQEISDWIKGI